MRFIVYTSVLFLYLGFTSKETTPYLVQKIQLKDQRLNSILKEYITDNHLFDVEGALQLKYSKDSLESFYIGYMVYNELSVDPPSHYAIVENKLILIYTGLEKYMNYDRNSFKDINKDCKQCFAEGPIIVEPTYWHVIISGELISKESVKKMPF